MTRDDIIKLMQQACDPDKKPAWHNEFWTITQQELERFADLVLKAERQACAEALREALDQTDHTEDHLEMVKPVAWMVYTLDGKSAFVTDNPADFTQDHRALPLYTQPPQRQPLTDEEILKAWKPYEGNAFTTKYEFARAIERAHGIGSQE